MGGSEDSFDWSEDEVAVVDSAPSSPFTGMKVPTQDEAGPSSARSKLISQFCGMGFSMKMVNKAIKQNGEDNMEAILESLLAYKAAKEDGTSSTEPSSSESEKDGVDEVFSDADSFLDNEEIMEPLSGKEKNLMLLVEMGFTAEDATSAIDRCGPDASLAELTDSIYAAQTAKVFDASLGKRPYFSSSDEDEEWRSCVYNNSHGDKKRQKWAGENGWKRKPNLPTKPKPYQRNILADNTISIPNPMTGFGVPGDDRMITHRKLPEAAIGPPYFYYENVALAPKGVWETISRFLYDIQPEFVDSKYFCAAARKRGYIHNLPIHNRFPIRPIPPKTIFEALPMTKKWWPAWDHRTHLNCLQTCIASSRLTERIRSALAACGDYPSPSVIKYVMDECRKWNLVWVGVHKAAPLEPDEIEMLLGFPRDHTRGGGISRTERYRSLGNSFQVDTVAYHLSVLKDLFPNGITVLSLFTGIGGGEVALHRLGIPLKTVVSVEISEINRNILRSWWESTGQKGTLIDIPDVQQLNSDRLEQLINRYGSFDLVIGGSPCNNLTGSNRVSRDGLEGKDSALFYDYFRILDCVKCLMGN